MKHKLKDKYKDAPPVSISSVLIKNNAPLWGPKGLTDDMLDLVKDNYPKIYHKYYEAIPGKSTVKPSASKKEDAKP